MANPEFEARSRLRSVFDVCEHEQRALEALEDDRLDAVLCAMSALHEEIVAALPTLGQSDSGSGAPIQS